jgi:hypothetical protein
MTAADGSTLEIYIPSQYFRPSSVLDDKWQWMKSSDKMRKEQEEEEVISAPDIY